MTAPSMPHWFKSSYSGGSGTECVECAHTANGTSVRDSKRADGPALTAGPRAWQAFIEGLILRPWIGS
ncbi:DUF397 domain-containing protein [Streptomyces sp. NPDC047081]|uniref:DUF397 domain-containing protein n=1 Tax=Streptomyces sp. NPDC047081 TaxID=3154706 RepID=UPI00340EC135